MIIEAPSEDAIELYLMALHVIARAGSHSTEDVAYVLKRLQQEQAHYAEDSHDHRALDLLGQAIGAASLS